MSKEIKAMLNAINNGHKDVFKNKFNQIMKSKVEDARKVRKIQLAKDLYGSK